MPFGFHGVFAALTGGVVFGLQGFEQAVHLAGEARDPKRDLSRAILAAMTIGALLYALLQVVMIGGLDPAHIVKGWSMPLGTDPSDYGVWYTLALALGAGWLAKVLLIDAVISPAGTGVVYVGDHGPALLRARRGAEMPSALATTRKGVPVVSILTAAVVGSVAFGPFKSWNALVSVVTAATAIMYAFAPLSLAALHKVDSDRQRSYRAPMPKLVLPAAFCSANLIMYWGGFDTNWKLALAMLAGLALFAIGAWRVRTGAVRTIRQRRLDGTVAGRPRAARVARALWRRPKHPAELGRHRRGDRLRARHLPLGHRAQVEQGRLGARSRQRRGADRLRGYGVGLPV